MRATSSFRGARIDAMSDADRSRLRRTAFGFVFQFGQLVPELPAIENVALPLLLNGVGRGPAEQQAAAWFPRLGLEGLEGRRAGEMSGGQAQRVAIARALVIEPAVIFADEPTGSLDSLAGEHVMELLTRAATDQGAAVVLVTHEARVAAYAHREIIVRDGRLERGGRAVIRLGLRLALSGGRGAAIGLALTAFAVATGTAILLFALSFRPALDDRAERAAWRTSFILTPDGTAAGADLLIRSDVDEYQGQPIVRVLVAGLTADPPTPPGVDRLPGPGEAVVSPALAALMKDVPADQLGDRIGTVVGTVGDAGLRSPDELVAIVGLDSAALAEMGASPITGFDTTPPTPDIPPIAILMIVLAVIGALVPVAVFVSTATRLSAARREQRLAALRLVGATGSQVTALAAVEALFVTIIGVVAGIGLFLLTRPLVAKIPLDNATWFPASIVPPLGPALVLLLLIPVVGVGAAVVALRRVVVTPLGVQRRQTPGMPGVRRAIPLVASILLLPVAIAFLRGGSTNVLAIGLVGVAFGGVIVGIVLVGPWLTYLVGRVLHALPGGASMLLASRRLTDDPRASFGAIAGVIMAVFVASAFFSFVAYADGQEFDRAGVIAADQVYVEMPYNEGPPFAEVPARIAAVPGVRSVLPIATAELMEIGPATAWVVPCVDLAEAIRAAGRRVRRRLGQGALGRWRHAARARLVHDHPGPGRAHGRSR